MNKSCPDSQMLSVYFDGEMPSPWKEKMDAHVSGCPDCKKRLETYRLISDASALPPDVSAEAGERVWQRLAEGAASGAGESRTEVRQDSDQRSAGSPLQTNGQPSRPEIRRSPIWRRRLSVPLPAAAAAAVLVIAFAFVLFTRNTPATEGAPAVAVETGGIPVIPSGNTESEIFPDLDMASVLQYLNDRDSGEVLIIRLPDSRDFLNYSEPAMIRSADYSPNVRGRRP